ncbi:hypothetical protein PUNSTDRAFT_138053 [Punctularia strigosozonata HHB-11173 SS5]|uniref:Uncharacterized protein n=1 Tax=Punctularia strigosozonata (strain HHB-11173) TaxID=741275 RepID=R7S4Q1_PUNST|nr:uncharacterized protein PUNSTDRAFT_138053 [Punctularia strigosozonata HHB-11173 SS5]EIN04854.1 hypothetical protein PUNSTDRAFT_138053 [Punctularia strigosozonata HHB-11173 SS5]
MAASWMQEWVLLGRLLVPPATFIAVVHDPRRYMSRKRPISPEFWNSLPDVLPDQSFKFPVISSPDPSEPSIADIIDSTFPPPSATPISFLPATVAGVAASLSRVKPGRPVMPGAGSAIIAATGLLKGAVTGFQASDFDQICGVDRSRSQQPSQHLFKKPLTHYQAYFLPPLPAIQSFEESSGKSMLQLIDDLAAATSIEEFEATRENLVASGEESVAHAKPLIDRWVSETFSNLNLPPESSPDLDDSVLHIITTTAFAFNPRSSNGVTTWDAVVPIYYGLESAIAERVQEELQKYNHLRVVFAFSCCTFTNFQYILVPGPPPLHQKPKKPIGCINRITVLASTLKHPVYVTKMMPADNDGWTKGKAGEDLWVDTNFAARSAYAFTSRVVEKQLDLACFGDGGKSLAFGTCLDAISEDGGDANLPFLLNDVRHWALPAAGNLDVRDFWKIGVYEFSPTAPASTAPKEIKTVHDLWMHNPNPEAKYFRDAVTVGTGHRGMDCYWRGDMIQAELQGGTVVTHYKTPVMPFPPTPAGPAVPGSSTTTTTTHTTTTHPTTTPTTTTHTTTTTTTTHTSTTTAPTTPASKHPYACIDGVISGTTLSSVSKHVRPVSARSRFGSLALTLGEQQLNSFSARLPDLLAEGRLDRHHLLIFIDEVAGRSPWADMDLDTGAAMRIDERVNAPLDQVMPGRVRADPEDESRERTALYQQRQLAVKQSVANILCAFSSFLFARLVDLTVDLTAFSVRPCATFATVRRLHVIRSAPHLGCFSLALQVIDRAFPLVEHLRFSGIAHRDRLFAVLRIYLDIPTTSVNADTSLTPIERDRLTGRLSRAPAVINAGVDAMRGIASRALERLYLQFHFQRPVPAYGANTGALRSRQSHALNWLVSRERDGRFVLLPPPVEDSTSKLAHTLWLANVQSIEQCWPAT